MKELNLTHKIAFALLCVAAFTNTFTVVAHVTLVRLVLPIVLCILLFTERVRLDSSFYVVCSFFFTYKNRICFYCPFSKLFCCTCSKSIGSH